MAKGGGGMRFTRNERAQIEDAVRRVRAGGRRTLVPQSQIVDAFEGANRR